jgi:hypothetical protein
MFGRSFSPAYLKLIHERYYQGKGTHPKVFSGGTSFRPAEGSLAVGIRDSQSGKLMRIVVGFVSISAYIALFGTKVPFDAPSVKENVGEEFQRGYQDEWESGNFPNAFRAAHETMGYGALPFGVEELNLEIDKANPYSVRGATYPVTNPMTYWRNIYPAHVEDLNDEFKRSKQQDFKRISDIFNLATDGKKNRALIEGTPSETDKPDQGLFNNYQQYHPDQTTLAIQHFALEDTDIYPGYIKGRDIDPPDNATDFLYKDGEDKIDVHIAPEAGIKHLRDGKLIIYSDVYESFADFTKPLDHDEYFKDLDDSIFYNKPFDTGTEEYKSNLKAQLRYLQSGTILTPYKYQYDQFENKSPDLMDPRIISPFEDRGSYIVTDP